MYDRRRYSDIVFTQNIILSRASGNFGYALLREPLEGISIVSAAAPNMKRQHPGPDRWEPSWIKDMIRQIFSVPVYSDGNTNTFVAGAFGCGAFGCNPKEMAQLFAQVLILEGQRHFYDSVVFAIPDFAGDDNAKIFMVWL